MDAPWLREAGLVLWTLVGGARVETEDGDHHAVAAGEGIWVPSGSAAVIETEPGSVAFPYRIAPRTIDSEPSEPARFIVSRSDSDDLILDHRNRIVPITRFGSPPSALENILAGLDSSMRTARPEPPLPGDPAARMVANEIRTNPALTHGIESWAEFAACSASTLRRGFADTGMTFAQWRSRERLIAARAMIEGGCGIEQAARSVGFDSRNGFTRAFRGYFGIAPRAVLRAAPTTPDPKVSPAPVPASHTDWHTNGHHVLTWAYRGEHYLRIGERTHTIRRGDAVWIPAGVEHQHGSLADALALPIADISPGDAHITTPLRVRFPPTWDHYLLHRAVAARTALRPTGYRPADALELFESQLAVERARTVVMPSDAPAREAATRFLARPAAEHESPTPTIRRAFLRETGMSYERWTSAARMRLALDLLAGGAQPASVARRLGYAHVSNFSRAFSRAHGLSPSRYRDQHRH